MFIPFCPFEDRLCGKNTSQRYNRRFDWTHNSGNLYTCLVSVRKQYKRNKIQKIWVCLSPEGSSLVLLSKNFLLSRKHYDQIWISFTWFSVWFFSSFRNYGNSFTCKMSSFTVFSSYFLLTTFKLSLGEGAIIFEIYCCLYWKEVD